jgi:hypothetical protein
MVLIRGYLIFSRGVVIFLRGAEEWKGNIRITHSGDEGAQEQLVVRKLCGEGESPGDARFRLERKTERSWRERQKGMLHRREKLRRIG